jgi:hypothetical protein
MLVSRVFVVVIRTAFFKSEDRLCHEQRGAGASGVPQPGRKAMKKDLLALLSKTKSAPPSGGVVRVLDDAELAAVAGGMRPSRTISWAGGGPSDCCD